jgi:flagellar biosynthetic protein FlhB
VAEESFQERSEQATPKRREEARKKGQVARSREIPAVSVLLTALLLFHLLGGYIYIQTSGMLRSSLAHLNTPMNTPLTVQGMQTLLLGSVKTFLAICWPFMIGLSVAALVSGYAQVGSAISSEAIKPDLKKINPLKGFGRIVSKQSLAELVKSILKIVIIGYVAYRVVKSEWIRFSLLSDQDAWQIGSYICMVCLRIALWSTLAMGALAGLDYGFQRWQHNKQLMMTRQEIKEELKQTEGDPLIKGRIKQLQRDLARRRMMEQVPKADVIVTNPTHLAVALQYEAGTAAPKVVAKGAGFVAERIREIATEHGVPIIEDKPLAQALYKMVDIGQQIPFALYAAVAEVLAYVYRLKNRRARA